MTAISEQGRPVRTARPCPSPGQFDSRALVLDPFCCLPGSLILTLFEQKPPYEEQDMSTESRKELGGKILKLADLVDYRSGTVASRMIVNNPAGSITIFSFDEGEGLSEHTAPYDAVVTILDGETEVWVDGETHQMKTGETIIFPANVPHALSAVTPFKMTLTMIRG